MLTQILLFSLITFSAAYPLCFWISRNDPLDRQFHHFHSGMPSVLAGLAMLWLLNLPLPEPVKALSLLWFLVFFFIVRLFWYKKTLQPIWATVPSLLGFILFAQVYSEMREPDGAQILMSILSGLILATGFYAMNLGHWYLNVHGLPMQHLKKAVRALGLLLIVRLIWDGYFLAKGQIFFRGELQSLSEFMALPDGMLLVLAFFFGTLFPLAGLYFVYGTIKVKSTQSATGILYALLSSILIGDITYKFYLLRFGIPL